MSQPLGFFPTTDRSKSVKAEDENYFDGEEGELWKPALLWRLVLCWWCRSTPHTVQKWISLFKNSFMLVAPFWDPKLGYIFFDLALFFGLLKAGSSVAAVVQEYAAHCSKMDRFVQKLKSWKTVFCTIFQTVFWTKFWTTVLNLFLDLFWTVVMDRGFVPFLCVCF